MVINIKDYVERWMNDYIIYHSSHFIEYGDLNYANLYFDQKYQEQVGKMRQNALEGQANAIAQNIRSKSKNVARGIRILDELQSGNLLEQTLDTITAGINEEMDLASQQVNFDNYNAIIRDTQDFSAGLAQGNASAESVNQFFDLLLQGVTSAGRFSLELLDALTDIGRELSGTANFQINSHWRERAANIQSLTIAELEMAQNIITLLNDAVERFRQASGSLEPQSFTQTVNNIFSNAIGQRISRRIIAQGLQIGLVKIDNVLYKASQAPLGNGKLIMGPREQISGQSTSRIDIFNSRAFDLSLSANGVNYNIEIGSNTSVKWYKGTKQADSIRLVSGSPLGNYFKSGTPERYLAYNIIAHRFSGGEEGSFYEAYRTMRAATAATFFNEWISGGSGTNSTSINRAQFLIINGKIYSVMRIIRNICNELANNNSGSESRDMPFNISISRQDVNKWQGDKPSIPMALIRSEMVNAVMDTLTVSANLNGNILTKYAY